jgi:alkylated DNA repair dioxygenase AlkB
MHRALPWTQALQELRQKAERATKASFNSVLLNLYRDGNDSVGWHADDEPQLGARPQIASLSLGARRTFQLKHRHEMSQPRLDLQLESGSLLWLGGDCQSHWQHQLPKRRGVQHARINLTFRWIRELGP